jgi:hypothetical protein
MDDDFGQKLILVLQYLLPGFLAAWVYYGLTPVPLPSQFERVIQALIFTLLVQPLAFVTKYLLLGAGTFWPLLPWSATSDVATSVVSAFFLGVVFAAFANNDKFHALMRWMRVTREMSYPSEWFGAFHDHETYVVLHLKEFNKLYGWPSVWPSEPNKGYFLLEEASWLDEQNKETPITNVTHVLVPTSDVQLVEFMQLKEIFKIGNETNSAAIAANAS